MEEILLITGHVDLTYLFLNSSLMLVKIVHHHFCLIPFGGK